MWRVETIRYKNIPSSDLLERCEGDDDPLIPMNTPMAEDATMEEKLTSSQMLLLLSVPLLASTCMSGSRSVDWPARLTIYSAC